MYEFIPMTKKELTARGVEQPDFVFISGDAYIDHPSFGTALIARVLEKFGYSVAIIAQPSLQDDRDFKRFGKPRLAFLVSSGNIDSMVNHYTVAKKRRKNDAYTPGGRNDRRPDRATIRYASKCRELFPESAIIVGGIEASLRRLAHYDYWSDAIRRSLLLDAKADLLVYGMAEKTIIDIAEALDSGLSIQDLIYLPGTVWKTKNKEFLPNGSEILPSYDALISDKMEIIDHFNIQKRNADPFSGKTLVEPYRELFVIQNAPAMPLSESELDQVYDLPFKRQTHPFHDNDGAVPALTEVKFSIVANRGCVGNCRFCALTLHQGRIVQSRSVDSIVAEAKTLTEDKDFKGHIHDIGGPTANFGEARCAKMSRVGVCTDRDCIGFKRCKHLTVSHRKLVDTLRKTRALPKVKKVFIRSGIRFDYVEADKDPTFFEELLSHHVSGQLKIAPEHVDDFVLSIMNKPEHHIYDDFCSRFMQWNKSHHKKQYIVPYLMSSHPGSTLDSAIALALFLKKNNHRPQQVQDFYPTPGTAATVMYVTEHDPATKKPIYVAKTAKDKALQRALIQWYLPQNESLVREALITANRQDLIGYGSNCLLKPRK